MLIIRKEQMNVLRAHMNPSLVDSLIVHMREHFGRQCEIVGEVQVRKTVEMGVEQAGKYGLLAEREVFLYLSLMFMLGSGFDTDVQYPWAGPILKRKDFPDGFSMIQTVYDTAMEYLDRIIGKNEEEHLRVLLRVRRLPIDDETAKVTRDFDSGMMRIFEDLHPNKYEELGPEGVQRLIAAGQESAAKYGLTGAKARMVYLLLMYISGSSFDTDPLFPWAMEILPDPDLGDENDKANRLAAAALKHLELSLQRSEEVGE